MHLYAVAYLQNMDLLERRLSDLEASRYKFGSNEAANVLRLLRRLDHTQLRDARSLIRFHEALLFLRAFPHSRAVVRKTESLLNSFHQKVEALRQSGADMSDFDPLEVSGIAGTMMEDTLSFDVARWLIHHLPGQVEIAWDHYDPGRELGTTGPHFMPLLEDDAYVEADTPYRHWLETAAGLDREHFSTNAHEHQQVSLAAKRRKITAHGVSRGYERQSPLPRRGDRAAAWLIQCFERLPFSELHKAELYESLRVPLRWHLDNSRLTRTRNWKSASQPFFHNGPLIPRSAVSLSVELAKRPPELHKLSHLEGEAVLNLVREVMLVRYRELYGTTLGDPSSVVRADVGRGVSIFLWNLPPDRRLPLRAYVAGLTLKNGVPINYIESIALCEWMEVGFNTFYTFRGGEAGWIYAQVLRCLCHLMGTTVISVYPYQLGHENEEAIESGAFWFYRKLGFRPGKPELRKLVEQEEKKIAANSVPQVRARSLRANPGWSGPAHPYRTPPRILKRLASGHVFYELPGSEIGAWDTFSTRTVGLRVNRQMARNFAGDARGMREHATHALEKLLGVRTSSWAPQEKAAFENFAIVIALVPELRAWKREEKAALLQIIRAKANPKEMLYLHLTQRHARLREAVLNLGRVGR